MSTKSWVVLPLALATMVGLSGCDSTTTTSVSDNAQTIKASTSASFAGRVVDVNGEGLSGVTVAIMANQKYTATTDANGNYLIEVPTSDVIAAAGGGTGVPITPVRIP